MQAEYELSPWGDRRADYHAALVGVLIANQWRGKGDPEVKLEDLLLEFDRTGGGRRQSAAEIGESLRAWVQGAGGRGA